MKGCKDNSRRLKVYWNLQEWVNSIYPTCLKWLIIPLIFVVFISLDKQTDEEIVNILTSVYTGILSSVIVTILIQKRQDKLSLAKKKAILFDATFLLNEFSEKYLALKSSNEDNWIEVYRICEKAASYLSNLYSDHVDVFDVMELNYLREINTSLFFIHKLGNANPSDLKKSNELTAKVRKKYSELVDKITDNLFSLIIKWNCDGIADIKLK